MLTKEIGHISSIRFGLGGYQDTMLGLHICFNFNGTGLCTSDAFWDYNSVELTGARGSEKTRNYKYATTVRNISDLLKKANVRSISELKGYPVEVNMDGHDIHSWELV